MHNSKLNLTQLTSGIFKSYSNNYNTQLIQETARGNWVILLETLGIQSTYLKNKHGPCPICGGIDRFRFDDKSGKGTFICNKCGAGDGLKLLQLYHGWSFHDTLNFVAKALNCELTYVPKLNVNTVSPAVLNNNDLQKRRNYLKTIWQASKAIEKNNPVDCYLKNRGIVLNDYPSVLRFHPNLPYYDDKRNFVGNFQAMLALVQEKSNAGVTIHRTYLENGYKANIPKPKKLITPIHSGATQGAAIKLFPPIQGNLALAEGIETALAFYIATQIPTWATISAGGMEKIKLPTSVTNIIIAVDHDESGRGQIAAFNLSVRLIKEGRIVKRVMPPTVGSDFADMLVEKSQ